METFHALFQELSILFVSFSKGHATRVHRYKVSTSVPRYHRSLHRDRRYTKERFVKQQ